MFVLKVNLQKEKMILKTMDYKVIILIFTHAYQLTKARIAQNVRQLDAKGHQIAG